LYPIGGYAVEVKHISAPVQLKDGEEGSVIAAFSVFGDEPDTDGDIVLPSFFKDGQEIPMAAWGHNWGALPPGKGVIRVTPTHAEFHGEFFLDTTHGLDHYRTVKRLGDRQEWSFGFNVTAHEYATKNGKRVRMLKAGETFEASPVLVGANRSTRTLAIKSGEPIESQADRVLVMLEDYAARERSLADLRAKEGRAISTARRTRIERMLASMREHADELEALLSETAPPEKAARAALAEFLAIQARSFGVQV
jgi:hypothetical protein